MDGAHVERQDVETPDVEVDVTAMDDAALEAALKGVDESAADNTEQKSEDTDNPDDSDPAKEGGEGGEKGEQEVKPPTVESLAAELAALKKQREQEVREKQHWQSVASKHSNELGELRKVKAAIEQRIAARKQIDPAEQMFTDPAGYAQRGVEEYHDQQQLAKLQQQEEQVAQRAYVESSRSEVHRQIQTIGIKPEEFETTENLNAIAEAMLEAGEAKEHVERWKTAPYLYSPAVTLSYWQRVQYAKAQKELQELRSKAQQQPRELMKKVEEAARKPLTNAGGGTKGSSKEMDYTQIAQLSDAELADLAKEVGV